MNRIYKKKKNEVVITLSTTEWLTLHDALYRATKTGTMSEKEITLADDILNTPAL